MQEISLPENTLVIWAHPDFCRDVLMHLGQHQVVKDLLYPCSEAGERAVGLILDANAGRRSWESLFLGAETPQRLKAGYAVNAEGDLQCPACQETSFGQHCGQSLTGRPACWRLPDDKGRHRWMSARAMEQLKAAQEWQKSASCTQCLRKLLLTAQSPHVLAGDTQPASQNGCEEELSRITGSIFCLSPNTEEVLARLKAQYETHWYTDIMVVQGRNAACSAVGETQARAQAAKLPQYRAHVLVAQPFAQQDAGQPGPPKQPRMVLDGEELEWAIVDGLLATANAGNTPPKKAPTARAGGYAAPTYPPKAASASQPRQPRTVGGATAGSVQQLNGAAANGSQRPLGAAAPQGAAARLPRTANGNHALPRKPPQHSEVYPNGAVATLMQPLQPARQPSTGLITSLLSGKPLAAPAEVPRLASSAAMSELAQMASQQRRSDFASAPRPATVARQPPGAQQDPQMAASNAQRQQRPSLADLRSSLAQKIDGRQRDLAGAGATAAPVPSATAATVTEEAQPMAAADLRSSLLQLIAGGTRDPASVPDVAASLQAAGHRQQPAARARSPQGPWRGGRAFAAPVRLSAGVHRHVPSGSHLKHLGSPNNARSSDRAASVGPREGSSPDSGSREASPAEAAAAAALALVSAAGAPAPAIQPAASAAKSGVAAAQAAAVGASWELPGHETFRAPTTSSSERQASKQARAGSARRDASGSTMQRGARGASTSAIDLPPRSRRRTSRALAMDEVSPRMQHSRGRQPRPSISDAVPPQQRISHLMMESSLSLSVVAESSRGESPPAARGRSGRGRGRGGRGRGRRRGPGRPPKAVPYSPPPAPARKRGLVEQEAAAAPDYFPVKRARTSRVVLRPEDVQKPWSNPESWLESLVRAAETAAARSPTPHKQPPALQCGAKQIDGMPRPSAPATPCSAAAAPLSHASASLSQPGSHAAPAAECNTLPEVAAGDKPAKVADAACSVDVSPGAAGGGGPAPEDSGVTHSVENAAAAAGARMMKKRRKRIKVNADSSRLSPPGAFGRAVFGRKKRGTEDVTYNEKVLRQQQWKAEQKVLQDRCRRRTREAADESADTCGDRTQLLMRLMPDQGLADGQCGFRMSVLCTAVLADAGNFLDLDLSACSSSLAALAVQPRAEMEEAAKESMAAHQGELERLSAYLNSPKDSGVARRGGRGGRLRRKPGRPRKTLLLCGLDDDAPDSSAPGTKPAALQPPTDVPALLRPGRPRKKPLAKFADATMLSVPSSDEAAVAAAPSGRRRRRAAANISAHASDIEVARAGSGGVTSALNAVAELCRDVNPAGGASSGSPAAQEAPRQAASRSRLRVMSGRLRPEAPPQLPRMQRDAPDEETRPGAASREPSPAAEGELDMLAAAAAASTELETEVEPVAVNSGATASPQQEEPAGLDTQLPTAEQHTEQRGKEAAASEQTQPPCAVAAEAHEAGKELQGNNAVAPASNPGLGVGEGSAQEHSEQTPMKRGRGRPRKSTATPAAQPAPRAAIEGPAQARGLRGAKQAHTPGASSSVPAAQDASGKDPAATAGGSGAATGSAAAAVPAKQPDKGKQASKGSAAAAVTPQQPRDAIAAAAKAEAAAAAALAAGLQEGQAAAAGTEGSQGPSNKPAAAAPTKRKRGPNVAASKDAEEQQNAAGPSTGAAAAGMEAGKPGRTGAEPGKQRARVSASGCAMASAGKNGRVRAAPNDWRLMKPRRVTTWDDIYARVDSQQQPQPTP